MKIEKKIQAFVKLGEYLSNQDNKHLLKAIDKTYIHNNWFTAKNIKDALNAIAANLTEDKLTQWLSKYSINSLSSTKKIGIIMAGNIPLVGFHDLLSVLITGNKAVMKLSSKDNILLPHVTDALINIEPSFRPYIEYADNLKHADAFIATGSDNSSRYFDYYFGKYPHIFRKNRGSIAILTGRETEKELSALGNDVFQYFGLGCRNVSKLFIPEGYNLKKLFKAWKPFKDVAAHNKYMNNYDYNLTLFIMNKAPYLADEHIILTENKEIISPVATLYYEYYKEPEQVKKKLGQYKDSIQCVMMGHPLAPSIAGGIAFGKSQSPELWDYADNVDTVDFLTGL